MSSVIRQNQLLVKEAAETTETSTAANFILKMNAYQPWFLFAVLDAALIYFAVLGSAGRAHLAFAVYAFILIVEGFVMRKKAVAMLEAFPKSVRPSRKSSTTQTLDPHTVAEVSGWAVAVIITATSIIGLAIALVLPMSAVRVIGVLAFIVMTRHHARNALAYYRARNYVGWHS